MAKGWYVVHTYSGYEQKIERIIRRAMETKPEFAQYCFDVKVPFSVSVEKGQDGKEKQIKEKVLPGYILVEVDFDDANWKNTYYEIKRIQGVSGFLTGNTRKKPIPLTKEEYNSILRQTGEIPGEVTFRPRQNFSIGDKVRITDGPFDQFSGEVEEINTEKSRLRVSVEIFGRATPVDVDFTQVEKI